MGKVVKFVGHLTGLVGGFITGGPKGALESLKLSLAMLSGNPFIIAAAIAADAYQTFGSHGGSKVSPGAPTVFRQSIADSFILYGRRRVGGLLVFYHPRKSGKDHFRYYVIAVAGHHIQGNPAWMLGDEVVTVDGSGKVTSGAYANAAWLWLQLGEDSETANATFVSECDGKWTSAHKGSGVAAIYAKFKMTDDVVQAGMPNITAVLDGKDDIADPRDDSTGYTNNAALVFYDWMKLLREEGGFGAYADEIPDDDWISAQANVSDEEIEGEARYAFDAVITTGAAPSEVRDAFVVNCAGSYTFSEGKHLLRVGYWVPPSATLEEADLAGPIKVSPFMTSDQAANEVQGTFIDPTAGYQPAPFATKTTDPAPTDIRQLSIDFAFIISKYRAERVADIMLGRAGCEKSVVWPMNIAGLAVGALDVVQLGTTRYGLSNYAWVVGAWGFSADFGVTVTVREENEDIYADGAPVVADTPPTIGTAEPVTTTTELQTQIRAVYTRGLVLTGREVSGDGQIEISDHFAEWPGRGAVSITGTTLTGLTLGESYYVYADIDQVADASPTFGSTTVYGDAINGQANPLRLYLNQAVTIPGAGDPPETGGGVGGGYGGGNGGVIP